MSLLKFSEQYYIKEKKDGEIEHLVLTAISIPQELIDKFAEENEVMGNLSHSGSDLVIKAPFK